MTDNEERKAMKEKIAALLRKAESTDNEHEAEIFMAKVNELLEKYEIAMHELHVDDPMGHQDGETNLYVSMLWARDLLSVVAEYYGAKMLLKSKRRNHIPYILVGRESARITAELMAPFIISQVKQQGRFYAARTGRTISVAQREVGAALIQRIWRIVSQSRERRSELVKNALVPVDMTQSYIDETFNVGKAMKGSSKGYGYGAVEHAEKISLHYQTSATKTKRIGN